MKVVTERIAPCIASVGLLAALLSSVVWSQEDLRALLVRDWAQYTAQDKSNRLALGLRSRAAEDRALSLAGIVRLALEDPQQARAVFEPEQVVAFLDDGDAEVERQAIRAYLTLLNDDANAERVIVAKAARGGGPLQPTEYIRYLRPFGITSAEARDWLLELAEDSISDSKFLAAEALVLGMETPPQPLLPEVMELIRSPEYFCHVNIVQFIPKFGASASQYLSELRELRVILLNRIGTDAGYRLAGRQLLDSDDLAVMDAAIAAIENAAP